MNPGTQLIIVPDGVLGAFPFEALVVKAGRIGEKCAGGGPVAGNLFPIRRHPGPEPPPRALPRPPALFALGDCIYEESSRYLAYKGGQDQAGELKQAGPEKAMTMAAVGGGGSWSFRRCRKPGRPCWNCRPLPGKPQPPQVLLDVHATETRVRQSTWPVSLPLLRHPRVFGGQLAGVQEPTLVLTQVENKAPDNGFLTFHKVLQLKLDAELVTLAACMTGVGQVMQGEGVLGFARAFQQAGARSVMVSLWNIPVDESMKFYSAFYKALREGKPKIEALKVARQAVRAKEPHPYFWSGLILHGEG